MSSFSQTPFHIFANIFEYCEEPYLFMIMVSCSRTTETKNFLKTYLESDNHRIYFSIISTINYEHAAPITDSITWTWLHEIYKNTITFINDCYLKSLPAIHQKHWKRDLIDYIVCELPGNDIVNKILTNGNHFSWDAKSIESDILQHPRFLNLPIKQKLQHLLPLIHGLALRHRWDLVRVLLNSYYEKMSRLAPSETFKFEELLIFRFLPLNLQRASVAIPGVEISNESKALFRAVYSLEKDESINVILKHLGSDNFSSRDCRKRLISLTFIAISMGKLNFLKMLADIEPELFQSEKCLETALRFRQLKVADWIYSILGTVVSKIRFDTGKILSAQSIPVVYWVMRKKLIDNASNENFGFFEGMEIIFFSNAPSSSLDNSLNTYLNAASQSCDIKWKSLSKRLKLSEFVKVGAIDVLEKIFSSDRKEEMLRLAIENRSMTVLDWLTSKCAQIESNNSTLHQNILTTLCAHYSTEMFDFLEANWKVRNESLTLFFSSESMAFGYREDPPYMSFTKFAVQFDQLDAVRLLKICQPRLKDKIVLVAKDNACLLGFEDIINWTECEKEWDEVLYI